MSDISALGHAATGIVGEDRFVVLVDGDPRLRPEHYPFVRDTLDKYLVDRLPRVRIVQGYRDHGVDRLAIEYTRERGLVTHHWTRERANCSIVG